MTASADLSLKNLLSAQVCCFGGLQLSRLWCRRLVDLMRFETLVSAGLAFDVRAIRFAFLVTAWGLFTAFHFRAKFLPLCLPPVFLTWFILATIALKLLFKSVLFLLTLALFAILQSPSASARSSSARWPPTYVFILQQTFPFYNYPLSFKLIFVTDTNFTFCHKKILLIKIHTVIQMSKSSH